MPGRTRQRLSAKRLSPRPAKNDTRLTANPDSSVFVNQTAADLTVESAGELNRWLSQLEEQHRVKATEEASTDEPAEVVEPSPGEHETANPVNHAQVLVPQEAPSELKALLANLGVNLTPALVGRKHVFDEFLRGRLVSLLAMGLSIRQAAAAIGLSHVAVWKEMKRNPELTDQVNAARFQAQIEPLLVILRESKRSWRAATWLIKYLGHNLAKREETPEDVDARIEEWRRGHEEARKEEARRIRDEPTPMSDDPAILRWRRKREQLAARAAAAAKSSEGPP